MDERVEQFRRRVEQHFGGRPGRGARYPEALRAEAIAITDWSVTRGTCPARCRADRGGGSGRMTADESPGILRVSTGC